jgi:hypothetical protein
LRKILVEVDGLLAAVKDLTMLSGIFLMDKHGKVVQSCTEAISDAAEAGDYAASSTNHKQQSWTSYLRGQSEGEDAMSDKLVGPGGRLYADPTPGPDEVKFREDNTSSEYYIIGLYSNVLDSGPGVISSQGGHFPLVDDQLGADNTGVAVRDSVVVDLGAGKILPADHPLSVAAAGGRAAKRKGKSRAKTAKKAKNEPHAARNNRAIACRAEARAASEGWWSRGDLNP